MTRSAAPRTQTASQEIVRPDAGSMIESMRAFGYSTPAAIADLIDNSISAGAGHIDIRFHWDGPSSWVCVTDDGGGMDEVQLTEAMRLGGKSPVEERDSGDLGRFGLGLKTASFSQCRTLTVASRPPNGSAALRRWDLDHVRAAGDWALLREADDAARDIIEAALPRESGTVVLWQSADRLVGDDDVEDEGAHDRFLGAIRQVEHHIAMTFHRFLVGRGAVSIAINDQPVSAWDPFIEDNAATQRLPEESLELRGVRISVAPYVLPHHSKLSSDEHRVAAGARGWNAHQGFYVYRGNRLLVPGEWLRLFQKEEHCKLARIRVDLPNSVDADWQIDVRKATARPPGALRRDLERIGKYTRAKATAVYRHRGKALARSSAKEHVFVWRQELRRGRVGYTVNRGHPVIRDLLDQRPDAERALRLVEETIPTAQIALDASERADQQALPFEDSSEDELRELAVTVLELFRAAGQTEREALESLATMEPFDRRPEILASLGEGEE